MAGILVRAITAEVALVAATAKTVLQIVAPANQRLVVNSWSVSFDGVDPTAEPVVCELVRQTTTGTMSALTPVKEGVAGTETLQATAQHTATAEPTATDVLRRRDVHPQSGYTEIFPMGKEIIVPGGGRLAIKCTAPANVNVVAELGYEE